MNDRLGVWNTKTEKRQVLAVLFLILVWIAGVLAPWLIFEPVGFWQKLTLAFADVVWAAFSGMATFFMSVCIVKGLED